MNANRSKIPDTYQLLTVYNLPEEIATSPGLDKSEVDKPLVLMLPDQFPEEFQKYGEKERSMSSSLFVVIPALLYTGLAIFSSIRTTHSCHDFSHDEHTGTK
jgi:hypothetical protein